MQIPKVPLLLSLKVGAAAWGDTDVRIRFLMHLHEPSTSICRISRQGIDPPDEGRPGITLMDERATRASVLMLHGPARDTPLGAWGWFRRPPDPCPAATGSGPGDRGTGIQRGAANWSDAGEDADLSQRAAVQCSCRRRGQRQRGSYGRRRGRATGNR